jgi:hypothetical protein
METAQRGDSDRVPFILLWITGHSPTPIPIEEIYADDEKHYHASHKSQQDFYWDSCSLPAQRAP